MNQVIAESKNGQSQFIISLQTPVQNPQETFSKLHAQLGITRKQAEAVERAWPLEEGGTMFHIIQAFTKGAQDSALDVEDSVALERAGGLVLSMVSQ